LKGNGPWERELKVLEDSDVRALNERALTEEEAEQRQTMHDYEDVAEEGGVAAFGVVALGEGRRTRTIPRVSPTLIIQNLCSPKTRSRNAAGTYRHPIKKNLNQKILQKNPFPQRCGNAPPLD
jgi:hypothetical protein